MKKYLSTPLTPAFLSQIKANLRKLPSSQRFLGRTEPQCDFCSALNPERIYAATRLTTGQRQDCWRWLACGKCHELITANNFNDLYVRAASIFKDPQKANGVVRAVLIAFHADASMTED